MYNFYIILVISIQVDIFSLLQHNIKKQGKKQINGNAKHTQ